MLPVEKIMSYLVNGKWKTIDPVVVDRKNAPCKQVILKGAERQTSLNFRG